MKYGDDNDDGGDKLFLWNDWPTKVENYSLNIFTIVAILVIVDCNTLQAEFETAHDLGAEFVEW